MEKSRKPKIRFKGFTDDWEQRKLSEIYQSIGNAFVGTATPYYVESGHFYLESNNVKDGQINRNNEVFINDEFYERQKDKWLHTGDMVMVQSGHVGHAAVIPKELDNSAAHALIMFRNPKLKIEPYFFNYHYQTTKTKKKIENITTGNTIKHILASDMQEFIVEVPNIAEQEQIGTYFKHLDNLITLHQRKLDKLVNVKKSMLEKMFPQQGSRIPEIRFCGFTDDWEQRKVRDVADRFDNLRIPVAANLRVPGATPYYGANGIQDYVEGFTHDGEFVLVAEDGANDLKNYPVKCVKGRIWVNNHAHVLQGNQNIADNQFLAFSINRADIESLLVGGGRAKLNAETMMDISLSMPNIEEQRIIGQYISTVDNLITLHQRKLEKLKNIKKSMLEKMFI